MRTVTEQSDHVNGKFPALSDRGSGGGEETLRAEGELAGQGMEIGQMSSPLALGVKKMTMTKLILRE